MGGGKSGQGQPSQEIFALAWEIFEPNRKLLPAPPNFEKKNIVLPFLKAT
jgi:hypothetical protein